MLPGDIQSTPESRPEPGGPISVDSPVWIGIERKSSLGLQD